MATRPTYNDQAVPQDGGSLHTTEWAWSMVADGSSKTAAAKALEISRPTLYDRLARETAL